MYMDTIWSKIYSPLSSSFLCNRISLGVVVLLFFFFGETRSGKDFGRGERILTIRGVITHSFVPIGRIMEVMRRKCLYELSSYVEGGSQENVKAT